jgi:hypothetical protein
VIVDSDEVSWVEGRARTIASKSFTFRTADFAKDQNDGEYLGNSGEVTLHDDGHLI